MRGGKWRDSNFGDECGGLIHTGDPEEDQCKSYHRPAALIKEPVRRVAPRAAKYLGDGKTSGSARHQDANPCCSLCPIVRSALPLFSRHSSFRRSLVTSSLRHAESTRSGAKLPYTTSCQGLIRSSLSYSAAIRPRGAAGRLHEHRSGLSTISQPDDLKTHKTGGGSKEPLRNTHYRTGTRCHEAVVGNISMRGASCCPLDWCD